MDGSDDAPGGDDIEGSAPTVHHVLQCRLHLLRDPGGGMGSRIGENQYEDVGQDLERVPGCDTEAVPEGQDLGLWVHEMGRVSGRVGVKVIDRGAEENIYPLTCPNDK